MRSLYSCEGVADCHIDQNQQSLIMDKTMQLWDMVSDCELVHQLPVLNLLLAELVHFTAYLVPFLDTTPLLKVSIPNLFFPSLCKQMALMIIVVTGLDFKKPS